jgi:hypothetical protein
VLRWKITKGEYNSDVVRDFLGAALSRSFPEDCGLLRPRGNWSAAAGDDAFGLRTINYVWSAVKPEAQPISLSLIPPGTVSNGSVG